MGKWVAGQPVIRRVIEPMAGSGFYANFVRATGFRGAMQVNDMNPLVTWTQREIVTQPDRVKHFVESIKTNLASLANQDSAGFFDSQTLRVRFDTEAQAQAFIESEKASQLREDIKNYFYRVIDNHFQLAPDRIDIRSELSEVDARAFLAAAFYIIQHNSARHAPVVINSLGRLNLPLSCVNRDRRFVYLLGSGLTNLDHFNYMSHIHTAQTAGTVFSSVDGWDLLKPADGMTAVGDLVIISGHFSSVYLTEAQFMGKIKEHVVPFIKHGGRAIIINAYSNYKAEEFSALGLRVFELRSPNTAYLLAVNTQVVTDVALPDN